MDDSYLNKKHLLLTKFSSSLIFACCSSLSCLLMIMQWYKLCQSAATDWWSLGQEYHEGCYSYMKGFNHFTWNSAANWIGVKHYYEQLWKRWSCDLVNWIYVNINVLNCPLMGHYNACSKANIHWTQVMTFLFMIAGL